MVADGAYNKTDSNVKVTHAKHLQLIIQITFHLFTESSHILNNTCLCGVDYKESSRSLL